MNPIISNTDNVVHFQNVTPLKTLDSNAVLSIGVSDGPATNTKLTTCTKAFDELVSLFESAPVGAKDGSYYVRGPMQGQRSNQALPYADLLIIDGDKRYDPATGALFDSCVEPSLVHEALKEIGIPHIIHTSHSHDADKGINKFRAIIPCRMADKNQLAAMVDFVLERLKEHGLYIASVQEMTSWSQPWFLPRRKAQDAFFKCWDYDGEGEENLLSEGFVRAETDKWLIASGKLETSFLGSKSELHPATHDKTSLIGKFLSDNDSDRYILDLLTKHGYINKTTRLINQSLAYVLLPPNSTTGNPGIVVYQGKDDGRWLVASHNGSVTLPRPVLDAFGLYQYLEHGDDQKAAVTAIRPAVSDVDFSDFMDEAGDVADDDSDADIGGDNDEMKATKSARRAVIRGESAGKILARIRKQWPQIDVTDAQTIVKNAVAWIGKYPPGAVIEHKHVRKIITNLSLLNERYAMLETAGNPSCYVNITDGYLLSDRDYIKRLSGQVVLAGIDKEGNPAFHDASTYWREHCDKRKLNKIVFAQNASPSAYNLFNGYGVTPTDTGEQGCSLILNHIREVICSSNQNEYEAMLNLIAWQLQNIGRPSRIIVAMFSEKQQVGKGALLEHVLLPLFGSSGFMTSATEHFLGQFNDTLRGKAFLFLDEAVWAKDRKNADRIKSMSQATSMSIETKGVPTISMPSGLNIWMATNHAAVASVETHDARYWILKISDHRSGDRDYFTAYEHEVKNGGKEAFLGMMLNRDVSDFHPQHDLPRDSALLQEVKASSRGARDASRWLDECLETGQIVGVKSSPFSDSVWREWAVGASITGSELLEAYKSWGRNVPGVSYDGLTAMKDFWSLLSGTGFRNRRTMENRCWNLPSIEECRALLDDRIAGRK